jgi:uncharacterized protein (DUF1800 family)
MSLRRRQFLKATASGAALLAATGCDKLPRELRVLFPPNESGPFQAPTQSVIDPIVHVLNRVAFGPRPGDYERIASLAATPTEASAAYLEQQLQPQTIEDDAADHAVRRFETLSEPLGELFEYQEDLLQNELMQGTLARAIWSERQLYEAMVEFWSDHFNIDPSKGDCKWLKIADDREVIRPHALGSFPALLRASALSPAMLWYLDGRVNRRANMEHKPNENYARELLELHTLGVHGGYTQQDVMEIARCLTGWTVRSREKPPYFEIGKIEFDAAQHDFDAKEVLGQKIAATPASLPKADREQFGKRELDRVLQIVTRHPATAEHIATKLCRRFIADEPPSDAISKVAAAFAKTGGEISETLRALFATEEFQQSRGNKFKRPFHFIVSALRGTDARTEAGLPIIGYLHRMGHAPFNYPTPDGYPEAATPWMGTLLWRWNFAVALSQNQIAGTRLNSTKLAANAGGDDRLMSHLLGRKPTPEERQAYHDSEAGLALILASPAFQRC